MVLFFFAFGLPELGINRSFYFFGVARRWSSTPRPSSARRCAPASTPSRPGRPRRPARSASPSPSRCGYVVLPQALRTVVPPLGSVIIAMFKNSAVVGAFGVGGDLWSTGADPHQRPRLRRPCRCSSASPSATSRITLPAGALLQRHRAEGGDRPMSQRDRPLRRARDPGRGGGRAIGTVIAVARHLLGLGYLVVRRAGRGGPVLDGDVGPADRPERREASTQCGGCSAIGLMNTLKAAAHRDDAVGRARHAHRRRPAVAGPDRRGSRWSASSSCSAGCRSSSSCTSAVRVLPDARRRPALAGPAARRCGASSSA